MYRIQGSDNKEYGPIPAETIRQWVGERRLDAATPACLDGEGVWKPLGQFAEFAEDLAAAASRNVALNLVKAPALVLLICGILGAIACLTLGAMTLSGFDMNKAIMTRFGIKAPEPSAEQVSMQAQIARASGLVQIVLGPIWNVVIALGAHRMGRLRSRGLAMTAGILAIIPCFSVCCLATIPIGIWVVTVLGKPEVRAEFTP
ncbi:MAG: DUF4339 domain-containing protein [Verrucomicrobia bacterium]|nr:MAG: DUF4339 domain-containing protein [Verrucomicrobiota bacterium]